jgi:hypothetical protein
MMSKTARRVGLAAAGAVATIGFLAAAPVASAPPARDSANGHGTLLVPGTTGLVRRQFSFEAQRRADGTVTGHATLINPAFKGANGRSPYQLDVDVSCMKVVGNIAVMGGTTRRTNDPSLVDAVFFTVQDNGEPGAGRDRISRAFFWDDDPGTQGDPQACLLTGPNDFPLEPIEAGNVQVRGGVSVP